MYGNFGSLQRVRADAQHELEDEVQGRLPLASTQPGQGTKNPAVFPPQGSNNPDEISEARETAVPSTELPLYRDVYPQTLIIRGRNIMQQRKVGQVTFEDRVFDLEVAPHDFNPELRLNPLRKRARNGEPAGVAYNLRRTSDEEAENFLTHQYRATGPKSTAHDLALKFGRLNSMLGKTYFDVLARPKSDNGNTEKWQKVYTTVCSSNDGTPFVCTYNRHHKGRPTRRVATESRVPEGHDPDRPPTLQLLIHHELTEQERNQLVAVWMLRIWVERAGRVSRRKTLKSSLGRLSEKFKLRGNGEDGGHDDRNRGAPVAS